jgi:1-acyl-sn-glycerol-3-phosphate acyltransferase
MEEAFHAGLGVVVFPEATSSVGREVLRFRPSLLEAAAAGRLPVVAAALTYRTPAGELPAHVAVCWGDATPFVHHVTRLLTLPSFEARLRFGAEVLVEEDRKLLAARLQDAVAALFVPTAPPDEALVAPAAASDL